MFRTFNMGIGMVMIVSQDEAGALLAELERMGEKAYRIGGLVAGDVSVIVEM